MNIPKISFIKHKKMQIYIYITGKNNFSQNGVLCNLLKGALWLGPNRDFNQIFHIWIDCKFLA